MKIIIKKLFRAVGSRMTYLLIGLSFSLVVIAVNAAVTITSTEAVSGSTLTKAKWDALVTDLENIRDEVNGQSLECVTKTSNVGGTNTAGDGWHYSSVECDAGWTMTGGGCNVNQYCWTQLLRFSYPTANGWYCGQTISRCDWSRLPTAYVRCCR